MFLGHTITKIISDELKSRMYANKQKLNAKLEVSKEKIVNFDYLEHKFKKTQ